MARFKVKGVLVIAMLAVILLAIILLLIVAVDRTPPEITISPLTVEYGQEISVGDLAEAKDNRTDDVLLSISSISPTDSVTVLSNTSATIGHPGEYVFTVQAEDDSGNISTEDVPVSVKDSTAPVLTLSVPVGDLEYGDVLSLDDGSLGVSAEDISEVGYEITEVAFDGASVSTYELADDRRSVELSAPGQYEIYVTAEDAYGNSSTESVTVDVLDCTAPEVTLSTDSFDISYGLNFSISDTVENIDWMDVSDISDVSVSISDVQSPVDSTYTLSEDGLEVEFSGLGEYSVDLLVEDSYANATIATILISYIDDEAPTFENLPNEFTLTESDSAPDFLEGVSAVDNMDGDITDEIILDALNVSYGVPGDYSVTYRVYDSAGNCTEKSVPVEIRDTTPPEIQLSTESISIESGSDALDFSTYLQSASDTTDGDLTASVSIDDSAVDYDTPGTYNVTYTVHDSAGNATRRTATVTVTKPATTTTSTTIVENTTSSSGGTVYITKTGSKYHRSGCQYLSKSKIAISKSDAIARGYTACSRCNP